jgi:hypothetical protein
MMPISSLPIAVTRMVGATSSTQRVPGGEACIIGFFLLSSGREQAAELGRSAPPSSLVSSEIRASTDMRRRSLTISEQRGRGTIREFLAVALGDRKVVPGLGAVQNCPTSMSTYPAASCI